MKRLDEREARNVLRLLVEKLQRDKAASRSWIRQPSNFISLVAILISLLSVAYQLEKDREDRIARDLASLSSVVEELTKIDSDENSLSAAATPASQNLGTALENRRVALLAQADWLIEELGSHAPPSELAVLGPEYVEVNDYARALKYFGRLVSESSSPIERISGWRSIAIVYSYEGRQAMSDVRKAFGNAASILPNPQDIGSIDLATGVQTQWAAVELAYGNYQAGFDHLRQARVLANRLPCFPQRGMLIAPLEKQEEALVDALSRVAPSEVDSISRAWAAASGGDKCQLGQVP